MSTDSQDSLLDEKDEKDKLCFKCNQPLDYGLICLKCDERMVAELDSLLDRMLP